ncbi:hypothetical protein [Nocardia mikamii]|nr:hypothetical protein [Nocardia mikamii]
MLAAPDSARTARFDRGSAKYLEDGAAPDQIVLTISHAFGTWALAPLLIR